MKKYIIENYCRIIIKILWPIFCDMNVEIGAVQNIFLFLKFKKVFLSGENDKLNLKRNWEEKLKIKKKYVHI